jgi:hypothetical protein
MNLEYLISAVNTPDWEQELKQISHGESVDFINQTNKADMSVALDELNDNSLFIFAIGAIYVKAKSIRSFPLYLAELIYKHVFQCGQGHQLFLEILNQEFGISKNNVARYMWGLCNHISNPDIVSFLKQKNSSAIIVLYWLQMAKYSTKHIFHIMERIQKKSDNYENIINFFIRNKTEILFDEKNGCLTNVIEKKSFYNFSLLFEIDWQFTFGEIEQIRNFLRSHPINSSFLQNCSSECSKNLIGTILNLGNYLDENYVLREDSLIIPVNVGQIHEFIYYGYNHLESIFQNNQFIFDNLLVPERYQIYDVFIFFHNLFLHKSFAFSRIIVALKTYGEKLSEENLREIPKFIENVDSSRRDDFKVWLALMCISRTETISVIQDYINVLKALFTPRIFGHATSISPFSPSTIYEVIDNIRKSLPDFILNTELLIVRWSIDDNYFSKSLLPVLQLEEKSISIDNSIRSRINYLNFPHPYIADDRKLLLFPCKLQLLMLSRTKDDFFSNLKDVLEHIGEESIKTSSNDITFKMMMEEMFFIMENIFKKLKISMDDFYNIYELLPKHSSNDISEAFINDPRFSYLLTNFLEERKVKQLEQKCREHLTTMTDDSKITDAQSELGIILMNCSICMANNTSEFTDLLVPCGHTFCHSCSLKLETCPNCRVKIDYRLPLKNFNIRIRKDSDMHATKRLKNN